MTWQPDPDVVSATDPPRRSLRAWAAAHPADVIDVFVYVVVLNLAIQYLPAVIS